MDSIDVIFAGIITEHVELDAKTTMILAKALANAVENNVNAKPKRDPSIYNYIGKIIASLTDKSEHFEFTVVNNFSAAAKSGASYFDKIKDQYEGTTVELRPFVDQLKKAKLGATTIQSVVYGCMNDETRLNACQTFISGFEAHGSGSKAKQYKHDYIENGKAVWTRWSPIAKAVLDGQFDHCDVVVSKTGQTTSTRALAPDVVGKQKLATLREWISSNVDKESTKKAATWGLIDEESRQIIINEYLK